MAAKPSIIGLQALQNKLSRLPKGMRARVKQALAQSADELTDLIKKRAPVGPPSGQQKKKGAKAGALRDSIKQTWGGGKEKYSVFSGKSPKNADPDLTVRISAGNTRVRYAHLVEFGSAPHIIKAKHAKALGVDGKLGAQVNHPGAKAQPFFYPSYRQLRKKIKARTNRAIKSAAQAEAKK